MSARRRLALAVLVALLGGCTTSAPRVQLEQLPEDPIAFVFIEPQQARDFAARKQELEGKGPQSTEGVARLDKLERYLSSDPDATTRLIGVPSLLNPRTGERSSLDALKTGSRPVEWSRDHASLLFASQRFDHLQLSQVHLATGEVRIYTQGKGEHPAGSLAPDGRLVFMQTVQPPGRGTKPVSRLFLTNAAGGDPQPLTEGPADSAPVFAPDGSSIAYETTGPDGQPAIAILQPPVTTSRILARGRDPVFTPDGQWIVYSSRLAAGYRIWRMRLDGSGRLALGAAPVDVGDEFHAAVSPDGRYVAYVAEKDGRHTLRVRRFDGGGDRELFEDGDGLVPVW